MSDEVFDLFGHPVRDRRGMRGRPRYEVTERNRNKVRLLLALGWANDRIANALAVSKVTLHRYFRNEMKVRDQMRDRLDAERALVLAEQAATGNVGAQRELQRFIERNDRMEIERALSQQPKTDRVGKKEASALLAQDADHALAEELALEAGQSVDHVRH